MSNSRWHELAEQVVLATLAELPQDLRAPAEAVPVLLEDRPGADLLAEGWEPDLLGLFTGDSLDVSPGESTPISPSIRLFVENIREMVDDDETGFAEEVRVTFLHEFGHLLGLSEADLRSAVCSSRRNWLHHCGRLTMRRRILPVVGWLVAVSLAATPANRVALIKHYDSFLAKSLARCTTCHRPSELKSPESLAEFPHNAFGDRLRILGETSGAGERKPDLATRLTQIGGEDSDGDGVENQLELLLGHNPGDAQDRPTAAGLAGASAKQSAWAKWLGGYRWQPLEPVRRPAAPAGAANPVVAGFRVRNPVDAFLTASWIERGLQPRPEAPPEVLLRRVYLDLIGLNPTPEEQAAYRADTAPGAYERVVDRLLADPRHAERWARHWMDVWRYSDWAGWTDGGQVRDSQPHIWRWRDWIVESLAADKPYDRMLTEMLAADEVAPGDPDALRATGFLVRNYKMLSREQWLEDTVKHTSQAFLGLTIGCAKCHDHMVDPISQRDYYAFRAIFEPHQVRLDRVPGELDTVKNGLARAYDATNAPTYLLVRGDERHPLTNEVIRPAVPAALGGRLEISEIRLPAEAVAPDQREFVRRDLLAAAEVAVREAQNAWEKSLSVTNNWELARHAAAVNWDLAERRRAALVAVLAAELPTADPAAGTNAVAQQRNVALAEAQSAVVRAQQAVAAATGAKLGEAHRKLAREEAALVAAQDAALRPLDANFTPRSITRYPEASTGRRLGLARWLTEPRNPLTARVAVNQLWLRHFGKGLVATTADFGHNGRPPTHPQLLDWLAAEFMAPTSVVPADSSAPVSPAPRPWSFRHLHRLMVTSSAYRMAATPDERNLAADPDNHFLWRMNSRRLEAEVVRDNLLYVATSLDATRGGPDLDQKLALTSPRRSLYLRQAAEKQAEFLQVFDGPSVTECYERHPSVLPQQALALGNSELALRQARRLAGEFSDAKQGPDEAGLSRAFQRILGRTASAEELKNCRDFISAGPPTGPMDRTRTWENLMLVLLNHSDFVTVR